MGLERGLREILEDEISDLGDPNYIDTLDSISSHYKARKSMH